jgi:hypothetical protein
MCGKKKGWQKKGQVKKGGKKVIPSLRSGQRLTLFFSVILTLSEAKGKNLILFFTHGIFQLEILRGV